MKTTSQRASHPTSNRSLTKRRLRNIEQLESRRLMASDLVTWCSVGNVTSQASLASINTLPTDQQLAQRPAEATYFVGDQVHGLVQHPQRFAVQFNESLSAEQLSGLGLSFVRSLNADYSIYEQADPQNTGWQTASVVKDLLPVFVEKSSAVQAVAIDEVIIQVADGVAATDFFSAQPQFNSFRALPGTTNQYVATVASGTAWR